MTTAEILQKYWGHSAFRPLQEEIISAVLNGKDALALLPTGGGKSICFQVPAMAMKGICIVVSPLIALMKDQVENLTSKGINAIAIYAGMGKREIDILLDNCIYGDIKFLYLSPERLISDLVRTRISYMDVCLFAIDEAHCISQWGYDFRPPYLNLSRLREIHPKVPILALTATATNRVRVDICEKLTLLNPEIFVKSFARENLSYSVFDQEDKYQKLLQVCKNVDGTGLVYVRNRRETAEVSNFLNRNNIKADFYNAGLDRDLRFKKQEDWKSNRCRVMVATNAFGMGIDKANVRFVVHLDLPESLEAYYQEAGRAGRDERKAYAVLLANNTDILNLNARYLQSFPTVAEVKQIYQNLGNYYQLAVGAGEMLTLSFDLADFCKKFKVSILKTIAALKFLERDGYIALSESVFLPSRLMFLIGHEDLYRFQIENKGYDTLIKTILRSYGGSFDGYVKIKESDIAQRIKHSFNEVVDMLSKLQQQEVLSYLPQTDQPQLQFLMPRRDVQHFDIDVKYLALRKKIIQTQIEAVISYATKSICRNIQLLAYFDDLTAKKCNVCDVCLEEKRALLHSKLTHEIEIEILSEIQKNELALVDLLQKIRVGNEKHRLEVLRELLDAGRVKTDGKKYYI